MANRLGGDPPAMRNLATKMSSIADRLDAMQRNLTQGMGNVTWLGDDANRFRSEWNGRYVAAMHAMTRDLRNAAGEIRSDATRQDHASGSGGGSGW